MTCEEGCWARFTEGKRCFILGEDGIYPACKHPDKTSRSCPVMQEHHLVLNEIETVIDRVVGTPRCCIEWEVIGVRL